MFTIYLIFLIFGGILVLFSLFSGGHTQDIDTHSVDVHLDVDAHNFDIQSEVSAHNDGSMESSDSHSNIGEVFKFFSFRNITYFMTFFGLTGVLGNLLNFHPFSNFLTSISIGSIASAFGYYFLKYLNNNESGESINISDMKGKPGSVSLQTSKSIKGKITIEVAGITLELTSLLTNTSNIDLLKKGDKILIIEIENDIAIIDKYDI